MVITKREDVTKQGFCKTLWRKLCLRGSLLLVLIHFFFFGWEGKWGGVGVGVYLSLTEWEVDWSWALIRGWALIGGLALIPINMVRVFLVQFSPVTSESNSFTSWNLSYGTNSPKRPEIFDLTIIFLKPYLCKNCNLCATYQLSPSIKYSSEFNSKFSFINFNF